MTRRERLRKVLKTTTDDLVSSLLYYDRKEDEQLDRDDIEEMFREGIVTIDEVASWFSASLLSYASKWTPAPPNKGEGRDGKA